MPVSVGICSQRAGVSVIKASLCISAKCGGGGQCCCEAAASNDTSASTAAGTSMSISLTRNWTHPRGGSSRSVRRRWGHHETTRGTFTAEARTGHSGCRTRKQKRAHEEAEAFAR